MASASTWLPGREERRVETGEVVLFPFPAIGNMSFLHNLVEHVVERIPEGIQRTEDTIVGSFFDSIVSMSTETLSAGILNPNSEI